MNNTVNTTDNKRSEALERELAPSLGRRRNAWSALIEHSAFRHVYPHLLIHTYHYVKFSCRLMELALSDLEEPRHASIASYLRHHIEEERGHDQWLLTDLESIGVSRTVALTALPLRPVSAMVGTQLYLLAGRNPLAILGYMFVLEAFPPREDVLRALSDIHKVPLQSMSTFLEHSNRDLDHRQVLIKTLDKADLTSMEENVIIYSALMTSAHAADFLQEVASSAAEMTAV